MLLSSALTRRMADEHRPLITGGGSIRRGLSAKFSWPASRPNGSSSLFFQPGRKRTSVDAIIDCVVSIIVRLLITKLVLRRHTALSRKIRKQVHSHARSEVLEQPDMSRNVTMAEMEE